MRCLCTACVSGDNNRSWGGVFAHLYIVQVTKVSMNLWCVYTMSVPVSMIDTLKGALSQDKYAVHLNVHEVAFMQCLLRDHPDVFRKIEGTVDAIMSDGKVDIFDLPQLIRLCSQIYHEHLVGYVVREVGVISLIRFTLDALLDSGILPIHGVAKDVIKKVIDTSLELLRTNVTMVLESTWSNFYGLFDCGCAQCKGCGPCKGCGTFI